MFKIKTKKGFTLVEAMTAISILSLAILGTFTAVQKGLQSSSFAKDQIIAFYLTEEAIEYIRNIRDENSLNSLRQISLGNAPVNWLHGVAENSNDPCWFGNTCKIDVPTSSITDCFGVGNCGVLNQNSTTGLFGYTPVSGDWVPTKFTREVSLQNISNDREVKITVKVYWTSGAFSKTLQVEQLIFNSR